MDILWAPWRMVYVSQAGNTADCLFCAALGGTDDEAHGVLLRGELAFLILNAFPYASGHVMAAPVRHVGSIEELSDEENLALMQLARRAVLAIRAAYAPDGFNLGANLGRAAGAGVEGHLHLHVVPRWSGDTNFMPVIGAVRVVPESLEETFRRVRAHLPP
jgi:ATP adenylyltransferase